MSEEMSKQEMIEHIIKKKELLRQAKAEYYKDHFWEFNKEVLGWPDVADIHEDLCHWVTDNRGKKRLLLIPRGHLKSSIITIGYTLWQIAKNPEVRILISNATYAMATNFLSQIKDVLKKNEVFKELYGDLSNDADNWRESQITVAKEGWRAKEPTVTVYGMGGSLTGQHYDVIILDDLVNSDNITTKDQLDKVIEFYKQSLSVLEPKGELLVVGTRWHQSDLYGWILDPENNILPSFAVYQRAAYTGEWGEGKILFPQKFTWKYLTELKREQGPTLFSSQYMNDPVSDENATFKKEMFRYFYSEEFVGKRLVYFTTVDPAISQEKEADFTVIMTIGVDESNNWWIADIFRDRVTPMQLLDQLYYVNSKYRPSMIGIEQVAFQKALQYFIQDEMRRRNSYLPVQEIKPDHNESKEMRIKGLEPRYAAGTIFHSKQVKNIDYLEDELLRFPKGKHDDTIDALSYMNQIAYPPGKRKFEQKAKTRVYSGGIFR